MKALVRGLTVGILANSATKSSVATSELSHRSERAFAQRTFRIGAHPATSASSVAELARVPS
jgi:hypothetical protein